MLELTRYYQVHQHQWISLDGAFLAMSWDLGIVGIVADVPVATALFVFKREEIQMNQSRFSLISFCVMLSKIETFCFTLFLKM